MTRPSPLPDVVLLHGWLMGPDLWDAQVAALDRVARLHPLGAPGHGTPGSPEGFTMAAWADLVTDELDRRGVERAVFVGHSMSGWLTQQIWRDHPQRVLGIGLIGITERPATADEQEQFIELNRRCAREWRQTAPDLAELLVGPGFVSSNPGWLDRWIDHVEGHYDLAGMETLATAIARRPDYRPSTARIDVPTVVIHGTDDRAIPIDFGRQLVGLIPGAVLVEVDGGHAPPMEQPAAVSDALRTLVARVS